MSQTQFNIEIIHCVTDLARVTVSIYETLLIKGLVDEETKDKLQPQLVELLEHLGKASNLLGGGKE